jgi:ABC-2 type transport system permease protein
MRTILLLVRKDLTRAARSPLAIILTLMFPVIFALLIALAFGTGDVEPPRVRLLIEDQDETFVSRFLAGAFESEQAGRYFDTTAVGPEGMELMERGEASALLRIPEGFAQDLLDGEPITLKLVRNPSESILPEIAEQTMIVLSEVLEAGSRLLRTPLDRLGPYLEENAEEISAAQVAKISVEFYDAIEGAGKYLVPPVVTLQSLQLEEKTPDEEDASSGSAAFSIFLMMLPGVSVWALFMLGDMAMRDILTESNDGTLRRQLSGPMPAWKLVAGKAAYAALLAVIGLFVLSCIAALALTRAVDPLGYLVLAGSVILAVTGFGALVYGLARTEGQGATFSSILLLVLAFLGGAFIETGSMPGIVQRLAPLSPFYWATNGFRGLLGAGSSWTDILPNAGILAGLGVGLLATGAVLLDRRVRKGGAA